MISHKFFAALAIVAALHSGAAKAQSFLDAQLDLIVAPQASPQAVLPEAVAGRGCTVYEHANGGGESWTIPVGWQNTVHANQTSYAQVLPELGSWWNDRISSLRCFETEAVRCSIAIHPGGKRSGGEAILWSSQGLINLAGIGYDDAVSSLAVFCSHLHG